MYGGVQKFIFERLFKQTWYRKNIRNWWFPVTFSYSCTSFIFIIQWAVSA
jgi:hypothetical protein